MRYLSTASAGGAKLLWQLSISTMTNFAEQVQAKSRTPLASRFSCQGKAKIKKASLCAVKALVRRPVGKVSKPSA
jgi:hypothetical protein